MFKYYKNDKEFEKDKDMEKLKELVEMIGNLTYREEAPKSAITFAKENGIVIVWGESDDLIEFRGAVNDECGCWGGGIFYFSPEGLLEDNCDCKWARMAKEKCVELEARWCDEKSNYSWSYKIDVPHETFEIMDDDEQYCQGIVFYLKDCVKEK